MTQRESRGPPTRKAEFGTAAAGRAGTGDRGPRGARGGRRRESGSGRRAAGYAVAAERSGSDAAGRGAVPAGRTGSGARATEPRWTAAARRRPRAAVREQAATTARRSTSRSPAASSTDNITQQLRGLPEKLAARVARHLVAAGLLLDTDPETAYQHTLAARARAARIAVVREACGEAAYAAGHYAETPSPSSAPPNG